MQRIIVCTITMNVQRLAPDGGGESLNVKPQAYGGRKIQHPYLIRMIQIVCARPVMGVFVELTTNYRVASIIKLV